ncbi:unnamed protein product [Adineta steineri]|uniref:Uncharacterized protein n=1 Tax=Adineta steineri TaxID=433720 RepID=A0A815UD27_9BILA|nr:unnamed protein product [Adineta steineri]CAF1649660.1 unnamed protein product [Adineta steineri]
MYENSDGFAVNLEEQSRSFSRVNSVILSQQASRFWLPFDVKVFEKLTPREYLEKFCKVNNRRHVLYKRTFDKHKDNEGELPFKFLEEALADAYMHTIDMTYITQVIGLLDLPSNTKITFSEFVGIAAFSERFFFNIFTRQDNTEPQLQKEVLEKLDFSSLNWKLAGVNISPSLRTILRQI